MMKYCYICYLSIYINEEYPVMLNVAYCRRVVTTGECRTALSGPAPYRSGVWSCFCYIRVATIVVLPLRRDRTIMNLGD